MRFHLIAISIAMFLTTQVGAEEKTIKLTGDNCKITFVGSKPDGDKHDGGFKSLTGTASFTGEDPTTTTITVTIDASSIYSDNEKLTAHLKNPDFFNVRKHPTAKFETTKVEKTDSGLKVTGKLTLLGVTKPVSFPAKLTVGEAGVSLKSSFEIDRTEFGMNYGEGKVNNEVKISVDISSSK